MNEQMDKILYEDGTGFFSKLGSGNYAKDEHQLNLIMEFARNVNNAIRSGNGSAEDVLYIVAIVHDLFIYADAGWTKELATEIYEIANDKVGC